MGKTEAEIFGAENVPVHSKAFRKALAGEHAVYEWSFKMKRETIHFQTALSPIRDADDAVIGVVGVGRDVTKVKNLEAQILQSHKMEAVGRLAGGVAHDFNNILTVVMNSAELAMIGLASGDRRRENIEDIISAAKRAALLTSRLLAFGRKQLLKPEVVRLNDIVAGTGKMLARVIGEDVNITFDLDPEGWLVRVDPGQIEQVLMNIAVNARDAMPRGGSLRIRTSSFHGSRGRGSDDPGTGDLVMLEMTDSGHGIDKATLSHIFEPFFTTKEPGKGTGLGLSIVYGIVEQSGGRIAVESEPGRGTSFRIYLPRFEGAEPGEGASKPQAATSLEGSELILVVEDDANIRTAISEMLKMKGYRVLAVENGAAALEICRNLPEKIDLLVTDLLMTGMNGRDLAEKLRGIRPGIPALFVSGYAAADMASDGPDGIAHNFLQKPFTPEGLLAKVREAIDSRE
jgi:two-component system cell cycle sensor histidine kinase/response regulator CckA